MEIEDRLKGLRKEYVYEMYTRIVDDFKEYEKITKNRMYDAIFGVYSDYHNIINICTTRELRYLEMIIDNKIDVEKFIKNLDILENVESKYYWERKTLQDKFIIYSGIYNESYIYNNILENVKLAIKNIDWEEHKKSDDINELMVSYCKINGVSLLDTACTFCSSITGIDIKKIREHALYNNLFNYYILITFQDFEDLGDDIPLAIYQDYYEIYNEIIEKRSKNQINGSREIQLETYKTLFYNDFDIYNPKIKIFFEELKKLRFFWFSAIKPIQECAMLNNNRESLKKLIESVPALKDTNLNVFFKTLDDAMDEMPSGALNGMTPNEAKKEKLKKIVNEDTKRKNYIKQSDANLSKKDAKLFYKIYFALLEFTNKKYNINPKLKIYNRLGINPYEISSIVEKFWKNKNEIIVNFGFENPYKMNKEELEIASSFRKGFRDIVIIARYEKEYTGVLSKDKAYMVKGINSNIDSVVPYKRLPHVCITAILPFKNVLIYDGIIMETPISMGPNFYKTVNDEYEKALKYYHL